MSKDWAVGEVFGFDEELLAFLPSPQIAVIVNIERLKKDEDKEKGDEANTMPYYQKQNGKLDNACGIIACLHAVFNNLDKVSLDDGSVLKSFWDAVKDKTSQERATNLENNTGF